MVIMVFGLFTAMVAPSPNGCYGGLFLFVGTIPTTYSWYTDRDLVARHEVWLEKKHIADTHWRCEACGRVFLPEERKDLHEDMAQNDGVSPDADVLENSIPETTENVSHLRRLD